MAYGRNNCGCGACTGCGTCGNCGACAGCGACNCNRRRRRFRCGAYAEHVENKLNTADQKVGCLKDQLNALEEDIKEAKEAFDTLQDRGCIKPFVEEDDDCNPCGCNPCACNPCGCNPCGC